jgi:hypothetical protein
VEWKEGRGGGGAGVESARDRKGVRPFIIPFALNKIADHEPLLCVCVCVCVCVCCVLQLSVSHSFHISNAYGHNKIKHVFLTHITHFI